MKKIYHACYTSHGEVMFRSWEDYNHGFNSLCSALAKNESSLFADSFMSDHVHEILSTDRISSVIHDQRISHTKYMNEKYGRKGPWGEPGFFAQEIEGLRHFLAAVVYVICNAVHHGIAKTPYAYPFSSVNCYFRKDLGKEYVPELLLSERQMNERLPRRAAFLPEWKMGKEGVFLRESVIEARLVEAHFVSPQAFLYLMSRKSGEEWEEEQKLDGNGRPPVTLEEIESAYLTEASAEKVSEMLKNQRGHFSVPRKTDLELCGLIDGKYVPQYGKNSVYALSRIEKETIANALAAEYRCGASQLRRCLVL